MAKTHFGYKTVNREDKAPLVKQVFEQVASHYDVMNDAMSFGLHRLWKNQFVHMLHPAPHSHVLDMAGGTGDIAFRILKQTPSAHVTVADINAPMLAEGKARRIDQQINGDINWLCTDAQSLPLPDNHFDYYTIAFGIRNVTDISLCLKEAHRVLKPGGRLMCLEFSHVTQPVIKSFYDFYSFQIIPRIGQHIAQNKDAYQYLVESIRMFPEAAAFKSLIEDAGFGMVTYQPLTFGVVAIHSGWKL